MQCVTPMIRYYLDKNLLDPSDKKFIEDNELKTFQKIVPRHEVLDKLEENPNYLTAVQNLNKKLEKEGSNYRYQTIPCGHCWACKLNYSANWATRIMYECKEHEHNYFITLTYNDLFLPIPETTTYNGKTYENDGTWTGTLNPKDIDRFINTLRRDFLREKKHEGIKFFYAAEYGETTKRPHFHVILMNCPLDINQFYDFHEDSRGKLHWKSKEIEHYWSRHKGNKDFPLGMVDIGEVEFASAAYVARYCMKKITDDSDKTVYFEQGKMPEYVRMSRRPGIGTNYLNKNMKKIYKYDEIIIKNFHDQTITVKPPKAWDKKFKELYPDQWEKIQESRQKAAELSAELVKNMTDMTDKQMLEIRAQNIIKKGKMLPRIGEFD